MQVRRCAVLYLEPREDVRFHLEQLLQGGTGLSLHHRWVALAPHLQAEIELDAEHIDSLVHLPQEEWTDRDQLSALLPNALIDQWLALGLLISEPAADEQTRTHAEADAQVRATGWHPLYAAAHIFGRWRDVDSPSLAESAGLVDLDELLRRLGPPPPATIERGEVERSIALPRSEASALDDWLNRRATCRNFDSQASLRLEEVAHLLQRVFAAQFVHTLRPGHEVLRKTSPSGGCLHPIETHLLARRVDGLAPGLYHYRPVEHSVSPITEMTPEQIDTLTLKGLAGQTWFANAAVSVVLSCRFDRHYWKYRHHAKAYRAMMLDAGHLSQTLYLSAADRGLGAYVTAAINEQPLEDALGLDVLKEGVIAMCGFGPRAADRQEFDFESEAGSTR